MHKGEQVGVILNLRGPFIPGVDPAMIAQLGLRRDRQLVSALESWYDAPYLAANAFLGRLRHLVPGAVLEENFMDFLDVVYLSPGTRYRVTLSTSNVEVLVSERDLDETT